MSTLSFPSAPSLNDTYTFDGKTWVWNGSAWDLQSDGAINGIPIGNTSPNTGAFTQLTLTSQGQLKFNDGDNSNYVALRSAMNVSGNVVWTLPAEDGNSGQVLSTDGAGVLSWVTAASGSGDSIFSTGGTMGLITEAPTDTEDLGLVTDIVVESYDLETLGLDGIVTNENIVNGSLSGNKFAPDTDLATTGNLSVGNLTVTGQLEFDTISANGLSGPSGTIVVTANLIPSANITYDLGNNSNRWNDLYLSGNSIYLGNIVITNTEGNTVEFFGADGTTPATISDQNVDTTQITNGNTSLGIPDSGGNIVANVGSTTISTISAEGISVTGNATISGDTITGNATVSGNTTTGNATVSGTVTANTAVISDTTTSAFFVTPRTISANTTVGNINAMSSGPIIIADGVTVTVSQGGEWSIV